MIMASISNNLDIFIFYFYFHPLKSIHQTDRIDALIQGDTQTDQQISFQILIEIGSVDVVSATHLFFFCLPRV